MKKFIYLILLWSLAVGFLIFFNFQNIKSNAAFLGVAEKDEKIISYGEIVEVKEVLVVSGEYVSQGQRILEVKSPELELRIRDYKDRLMELQALELHSTMEIKSQISQLEAEILAKEAELTYEIRQLETQYGINKDLTSDLRSLASIETDYQMVNPTAIRMEALREDLHLLTDPMKVRIKQLESQLNTEESPYKVQIKNILVELEKLKQEQERLNVYAAYDGVIGFVMAKAGDVVAPHMPIVSVDSHTPTYVNGFIHENSYQEIRVNDKIEIASDWNRNKKAIGEVVGIGSKITEYPERLRKNLEVRLWGREVQIRIPEDNVFLQGEKVTLRKISG